MEVAQQETDLRIARCAITMAKKVDKQLQHTFRRVVKEKVRSVQASYAYQVESVNFVFLEHDASSNFDHGS